MQVALVQPQGQGKGQPAQQLAQNSNTPRPRLNGQPVTHIRSQVNISQQRIPAVASAGCAAVGIEYECDPGLPTSAPHTSPRYRRPPVVSHLHREHQQHQILLVHRRPHNIKVMLSLRRTCPMLRLREKTQPRGCTFCSCTGYSLPRSNGTCDASPTDGEWQFPSTL
jgi:hypothetical protein